MGMFVVFVIFGVGFFFCLFGGVIFGYFGDWLGCKCMLMLIVWMMGIVIVLIGIFFLFLIIGWWVFILLVILCVI